MNLFTNFKCSLCKIILFVSFIPYSAFNHLITCEYSKYEFNQAHKTAHIVYGLYSDYIAVLAQIIGMLASQNTSRINIKSGKLMFRYEPLTMIVKNEKIEKRLGIKAHILNRPPPEEQTKK